MTNPLIEQKVKELRKQSAGYGFVTDESIAMFEEQFVTPILLSLYNQGRLDALGQLESVLSGYEGNRAIIRADILSHIASLKEPLINI